MAFVGTWNFESSQNFEDYLRAIGLGIIQRKLAASLKPTYHISKDGDTWIIKMILSIKTREIRFVEGVEFDEEIFDGRKVRTIFSIDGDKMIQVQRDPKTNELKSTITRVVQGDKLVMTLKFGNIIATRVFKRS